MNTCTNVVKCNKPNSTTDAKGNVTDSAANPIAINTYDEYGIPSATNIGRFQYTGQMWIGEAGMYAPTYRALFAHLGRYGQTDPVGFAGGMNVYVYAGGDPVNRVDPLGLSAGIGCLPTIAGPQGSIIVTACVADLVASLTGTSNILDLARDLLQKFDRSERNNENQDKNKEPCTPTQAQLQNSGKVTFGFSEGGWSGGAIVTHLEGSFTTAAGYSGQFETRVLGVFIGERGPTLTAGIGTSQSLATFAGGNYNLGGAIGPWSGSLNFDPSLSKVGSTNAVSMPGYGATAYVSDTRLRNVQCPR